MKQDFLDLVELAWLVSSGMVILLRSDVNGYGWSEASQTNRFNTNHSVPHKPRPNFPGPIFQVRIQRCNYGERPTTSQCRQTPDESSQTNKQ
ncbi:hypothetical protein BofuT4_uP056280.1 [Botrytis cinerea T4]|uniref:Uncharacterized protein n=1 Tax=Botryotinia fuckeliana (strain T4) TaxID=999810 RepID=G2XW57_BOTF4|nr:hypothetical protein BofuT4_uP056280.1 [Botrytis cinerea T4]